MRERPPIAVYGATGHTGGFVLTELRKRGWSVVAVGREPEKLTKLRHVEPETDARVAAVDDPAALNNAFDGCCAVLNCAGPFLDTAASVIEAAINAGIHYLDVTAEQPAVEIALERYTERAYQAGVAVVPASAFYGALGDLLACAAMGDWGEADELELATALDSWHPTVGTRATGRRNTTPRKVIRDGRLELLQSPAPTREWIFGRPFGKQPVVELPFSETILIAHHLQTRQLRNWFATGPLSDLRNPLTPPPVPAGRDGRSAQNFRMECVARRALTVRRTSVSGTDIYAVSAPLIVGLAEHVLRGAPAGVLAAGEIVNAREFLEALSPGELRFTIESAHNAPVRPTWGSP